MYEYRAALEKNTDGDTLLLHVDLGAETCRYLSIRLKNVWAPETGDPGDAETQSFIDEWMRHLDPLRKWPLRVNTDITKVYEPNERRSFIRYIAQVHDIHDGRSLNADIQAFLAQHPEWGSGIT
jgi:hypothetical protein